METARYRPLNAGELRHRVQRQTAVATLDSFGESKQIWQNEDLRHPARIVAIDGTENEIGGAPQATRMYEVTMRWLELVPKQRLYADTGKRQFVLEVLAAIDIEERNRTLVLTCRELING